jgi:hypothetical protein
MPFMPSPTMHLALSAVSPFAAVQNGYQIIDDNAVGIDIAD